MNLEAGRERLPRSMEWQVSQKHPHPEHSRQRKYFSPGPSQLHYQKGYDITFLSAINEQEVNGLCWNGHSVRGH